MASHVTKIKKDKRKQDDREIYKKKSKKISGKRIKKDKYADS